MPSLKTLALTAPSSWASFLINGDGSGLEPAERVRALAWLQREKLPPPCHCEDAGFMRWHDAREQDPRATECQTYFFLVERKARA